MRDPLFQRLFNHRRVVRVEEYLALAFIEVGFMFGAGRFLNPVGVIQQHAEVANASDAGFRTDRRLAGFNPWIAENALLRFAAFPVEVDFFIRTAADAHAPAAAFILIDQYDAILFALIDSPARAGRDAARVKAVFAQARQIHHEGIFKLAVHLFLHGFEVAVTGALFKLAAEQLFPVGAPADFVHPLTADQRTGAGGRQMLALRRGMQMLVIVGEGFVIVVDARQLRVGEDFCQHANAVAEARRQLTGDPADPAALPLLLVFPVFRVADTGFGFDIVKPGVFHPFASGPDVLAGDRAGMAADAFVEIEHHANL